MNEMKVNHSPEIKDLVAALAKAQSVMKPAVFNKGNPHFKSRYADFSSCMDACRIPLSENGLAPIQYCETIEGKLYLVTMLAHVSGQWMKSEFPLNPVKQDSQGIGSAMTYAKRYSLCGMIGIVADEDDDGEGSVGRGKPDASPSKFAESLKTLPEEWKKATDIQSVKITKNQVEMIKKIEAKLDEESKSKLSAWLGKTHGISDLKDIPGDLFAKVFGAYERALTLIENLELAHA